MPRYDFNTPRLYVAGPLAAGGRLVLDPAQTNYLRNALRLGSGDAVLVFNGREGEWRATLANEGKRALVALVGAQSRALTHALDLHVLFAPLKHARLDYMVQKAVEMGAARLQPVLTRHTQVARVNLERMGANAIEAAEQCGILTVAQIAAPLPLERALAEREAGRLLVFCDETADVADPIAALMGARMGAHVGAAAALPLAVLIGPEGGFAEDERALLLRAPNVVRLALGPRILRADTAAVAALALVGAALGDWR
jgi:16S rRNA (uracil1498-N3)-methyltransferase